MNPVTPVTALDAEIAAQIESRMRAVSKARTRVSNLQQAVTDAEKTVARGPARVLQLQALLASLSGAETVEAFGRRLMRRGQVDHHVLLDELIRPVVVKTFGPAILKSAAHWCNKVAATELAALRSELKEAESALRGLEKTTVVN
jgi:uncharacterized protein involved in exopolysaccharide biosynthesis